MNLNASENEYNINNKYKSICIDEDIPVGNDELFIHKKLRLNINIVIFLIYK